MDRATFHAQFVSLVVHSPINLLLAASRTPLRVEDPNQTLLIAPVEASSAGPTKSNASHPRSGSTRLTCTITGI